MIDSTELPDVDPELRDAVIRALEERPDDLREFLRERGYLPVDSEEVDELVGNEQELSEPEQQLLDVVTDLGSPHSTQQIIDIIQREDRYRDLREQYDSLKHRPWVSDKLNKLVRKGMIGRYRDGRTVMYTPDPEEAIRHWALHNDRFLDDLTFADVDDIVSDTNMDRQAVRRGLRNLLDEGGH